DVVEFIAKKLVDNIFVLAIDFEKVCQRAHRSGAVETRIAGVVLEDIANRIGRVAMLANQCLKRAASPIEARYFAAKLVAAAFALRLLGTTGFDLEPKVGDLSLKALEPLGDGLKRQPDLSALKAERLKL